MRYQKAAYLNAGVRPGDSWESAALTPAASISTRASPDSPIEDGENASDSSSSKVPSCHETYFKPALAEKQAQTAQLKAAKTPSAAAAAAFPFVLQ